MRALGRAAYSSSPRLRPIQAPRNTGRCRSDERAEHLEQTRKCLSREGPEPTGLAQTQTFNERLRVALRLLGAPCERTARSAHQVGGQRQQHLVAQCSCGRKQACNVAVPACLLVPAPRAVACSASQCPYGRRPARSVLSIFACPCATSCCLLSTVCEARVPSVVLAGALDDGLPQYARHSAESGSRDGC